MQAIVRGSAADKSKPRVRCAPALFYVIYPPSPSDALSDSLHLTSIINLRSPPTVYHFRMNSSCLVPLPAPWRHRNKCVSFFCFYKTGNNLVHLLKVCFPHPPSPHVFCVYVRASIQSACRRTPLPSYSYNLFIFRLRSTISFWR